MKTNHTILLLVVITMAASCKPNVPELNESNSKMLIGSWQVTKETVTNGDGFGSVFTREVKNMTLIFEETFLVLPTFYYISKPYTLQQQQGGTWLLTIEDYYDKQRNLEGGCSPITIYKLTKNNIEWEYESYGGDEGPVVYYQYLTRVNSTLPD